MAENKAFSAKPGGKDYTAQKDTDQTAGFAAGVASAIMIAAGLAAELTAKLKLGVGSTAPSQWASLARSLDWTVTSRAAAIAVSIEKAGYEARKGLSALQLATADLTAGITVVKKTADDTAAAVGPYPAQSVSQGKTVTSELQDAADLADKAEKAAKAAAEAAQKALQEIGTLTGLVKKVTPDDNGDIVHQSINDWRLNANSDITLNSQGNVSVFAQGETGETSGTVSVTAAAAITLSCGPNATIGMNYAEDLEESNIVVRATGVGTVQVGAGSIETGSRHYLTPEGLMLKFGDTVTGPRVVLTETGIELSVGPPGVGASIVMTDESITIKVAESSFTMTAEGINEVVAEATRSLNAEGHVLAAAESLMNIGLEGRAYVGPTITTEVDAASESTQALSDDNTEGEKMTVAAMFTVE